MGAGDVQNQGQYCVPAAGGVTVTISIKSLIGDDPQDYGHSLVENKVATPKVYHGC